jgi:hypothetical protein
VCDSGRLKRGGVLCPEVVVLKKHVLVMSFVGHDHVPAPKLKEARLVPDKMADAYAQVTQVSTPIMLSKFGGVRIVLVLFGEPSLRHGCCMCPSSSPEEGAYPQSNLEMSVS